jgi:hypothetical protein
MEEAILKILLNRVDVPQAKNVGYYPTAIAGLQTSTLEIAETFRSFLRWKDHPKNEFNTSFNGIDGTKPKVRYERNGKPYDIDELFNYFLEHDKSH